MFLECVEGVEVGFAFVFVEEEASRERWWILFCVCVVLG